MAESVASKIRIDLLANVAQFKAGMREAGRDGAGAFKAEFDKQVKGWSFQKNVIARMNAESANWHAAMDGILTGRSSRGSLRAPTFWGESASSGSSPWGPAPGIDQALRNRIRARDYLPWGTSFRSEMSKEAALTALAIGDHKQTLVRKLTAAARDLGTIGMGGGGFGIGSAFRGVGQFAKGHPLATAAVVAVAAQAEFERRRITGAREVRGEQLMLGQSAEDTSVIRALGLDTMSMSRFQKNLSDMSGEAKKAIGQLRLDPEKLRHQSLLDSLKDVGRGFEKNLTNPVDRTSVAMHLFGESGTKMLGTLAEMEERLGRVGKHEIFNARQLAEVKAMGDSWKAAKNSLGAVGSGVSEAIAKVGVTVPGVSTWASRRVEDLGFGARALFSPGVHTEWNAAGDRRKTEDYNVRNAEALEKTRIKTDQLRAADNERKVAKERIAELARKETEALTNSRAVLADMLRDDRGRARESFSNKLVGDGMEFGSEKYRDQMAQYDSITNRQQALGLLESIRSPEETAERQLDEIDKLYRDKGLKENEFRRLERHYLESYWKEKTGIDPEGLRKDLATPTERWKEQRKGLDAMQSRGIIEEELADRARARADAEARSALGIRDPFTDLKRAYRDLEQARPFIPAEDFAKRRGELRRNAIDQMMGDERRGTGLASGALQGSQEAYRIVSESVVGNQQAQAMQRLIGVADQMERHLATLANRPEPQEPEVRDR